MAERQLSTSKGRRGKKGREKEKEEGEGEGGGRLPVVTGGKRRVLGLRMGWDPELGGW
jgi:hypothetical protein